MGTSVSSAFMARIRTIFVACATFALTLGLAPATSLAADTPMLASSLLDGSTVIVSEDVELVAVDEDGADVAIDPIIGSFTVDGLTFALSDDGVTLVSVSPDAMRARGPDGGRGEVAPEGTSSASEPSEPSAPSGPLAIPSNVSYDGVTYDVTTIGLYAFYLSGVTQVELPASIVSVDDRAFRSSDVERVEVASDNLSIASFDGCLYDSQLLSLLLIPEGRAGAVLLPETAEEVQPSKFSHCSLVDAISVEEGGAAFASWDGLLYDANGTTLLRVPAGATDITIREGCTTIAAGAMAGCAKLERINAPSTVTSISPNVFESVPTISFPASVILSDGEAGVEGSPQQLNAMVAVSTSDLAIAQVDPSTIAVAVPDSTDGACWEEIGVSQLSNVAASLEGRDDVVWSEDVPPAASGQSASTYQASSGTVVNLTNSYARAYAQAAPQSLTLSIIESARNVSAAGRLGVTIGNAFATNACSSIYGAYGSYVDPSWPDAVVYWSPNSYAVRQTPPVSAVYSLYYELDAQTVTNATRSALSPTATLYLYKSGLSYVSRTITWDANGGTCSTPSTTVTAMTKANSPVPTRPGYECTGWYVAAGFPFEGQKVCDAGAATGLIVENRTLEAHWERIDYDLSFDTDSEPDHDEYPSEVIPDQDVNVDDGAIEIEDPKRPGYVFQGWVIPNGEGIEAIDQDLVYQDDDGKWYVDASKLPDYATDGKVELTARWTSIISVDVPSAVTFYADVVTQDKDADDNQKSLDGAVDDAFGQAKVTSQSQVDLRIVGLESEATEGDGANSLGASDVLVDKASASVPASSGWKLFSLFPSSEQFTADDLKDKAHVSAQPAGGVTFDIDDILLEKSFAAEDFTIPAGETLNLGYRLNLKETQQALDYDKLATLEDGQSAAIANISYCFSADPLPSDWGEPLWIENPDQSVNPARYLLLDDIKEAADDLSANGEASQYYGLYKNLLDAQVTNSGNPGTGPYFKVNINGTYWDLQLIGICQDTKSDGTGKAGLTFQLRDMFSHSSTIRYPGSGTYTSYMNSSNTNANGWAGSYQYTYMRSTFWGYLPSQLRSAIVPVNKYQQLPGGTTAAYLQLTANETVWLPSMYEVFGIALTNYNESEGLTTVAGYTPFQYMAYQGNNGDTISIQALKRFYTSATANMVASWWLRSASRGVTASFCYVHNTGSIISSGATAAGGVVPCFCL